MKHLKNTDRGRNFTRAAILGLTAAALLCLTGCHSTHGNRDRNLNRDTHHDDQHNRNRNTDRDHHDDRNHDRPRR